MVVEYLGGLPFQLRFRGVELDAALRVAGPLAQGGGEPAALERDWMRLAALAGSAEEYRVFEERFLVDAISADKGLGLARDAGQTVVILSDPADPQLASLAHPAAVRAAIEDLLRLGYTVEVPTGELRRKAWRGSLWRAEDPASGAAGYFLSGALAGGATTEPPEEIVQDLPAGQNTVGEIVLGLDALEPERTYLLALEVDYLDSGGQPLGLNHPQGFLETESISAPAECPLPGPCCGAINGRSSWGSMCSNTYVAPQYYSVEALAAHIGRDWRDLVGVIPWDEESGTPGATCW